VHQFTITELQADGTFTPAASFASYTEWSYYVFPSQGTAGPTPESRLAMAKAAVVDPLRYTLAPPVAQVQLLEADTEEIPPGMMWFEQWVKYLDHWTRVAYGTIPFQA
jgi:hypothetical protein